MTVRFEENKPIFSYLIFFYSFCIALIICYFFLALLNIKPESAGDLSYLLPVFRDDFFPQGYKMKIFPLGFGIIIFSTISLYFLLYKVSRQYPKISSFLMPLALFSAVILFFAHIKTVASALEYLKQFSFIFKISPIIFSPIHVIFFLFCLFFLLTVYFYYEKMRVGFSGLTRVLTRVAPVIAIILIVITLVDRHFQENLLFYGPVVQYEHTIPIVAPVSDVLLGKVLMVNSNSQYGLLLVYLNALIFKFLPLTFVSFYYLLIFYGILYYLCAFALLRKRLTSNLWALIGLFPLFTLHFYAVFDRFSRPMTFPLRYLLDLPFFLILFSLSETKQKRLKLILPLFLAIAFYYNYESGMSLAAGYLFYLFLKTLINKEFPTVRAKFASLAVKSAEVVFFILSLGIIYSLYAKAKTDSWPDWPNAFFFIINFSKGFGAERIPPAIGLHFYTWAVYFIVLLRSLIGCIQKRIENIRIFDATLALYGFIISLYFIKSPYILNLAVTSVPAIILSVVLFKDLFEYALIKREHQPFSLAGLTFLAPFVVLGSILVFSFTFYLCRVTSNPFHNYWESEVYRKDSYNFYDKAILASSAFAKYEKDKKEVALLSYYDGFLRLKAGKLNSLGITNFQMVLTKSHVESLFKQLTAFSPEYIYADNDSLQVSVHPAYLRYFVVPQLYEYIFKNYHKIETLGFLDVWQRNQQ